MDLGAFIRVAWRFRALLAGGILLATVVAMLSVGRVQLIDGKPAFTFRQPEVWLSTSTVLVTQDGFPWGRAVLDEMIKVDSGTAEPTLVPRFGDQGRYAGLAALYAELAKGDAIQRSVAQRSIPGQRYEPVVVEATGGTPMPLLYFNGYGPSAEAAIDVAKRSSNAFRNFLTEQQTRSGIRRDKRVEVVVTQQAGPPTVFEARSYVRPLFLFLLISMAFLALAFALENFRPRARPELREAPAASDPPARAA
jgi:hypothetical protein